MSSKFVRCLLVNLWCCFFLAATVHAQAGDAEPGVVSGIGTVMIKQKPSVVRMTIQLEGKGKTLKEALAQLKDLREAAILQLQSSGAKKESIAATDPVLGGNENDQQRQMQRMMMQQLRAGGRATKALQMPKSVAVASTLTAEWPIPAKSHEELLTFTHDLQNKIEEADLGGLKQPKQLSPEEAELQEELAQLSSQYGYDDNQPKAGQPHFVYVARITDKERDAAMAEAFAKAKQQAEKLAAAAGSKLGKLASLNGDTSPMNDDSGYGANAYAMQMMMRQMPGVMGGTTNEDEAFVGQLGTVNFQVMVNATFELN